MYYICSANLNLNKYRRMIVAPYMKKDLKKQLLDMPVKHDSIFGNDFEKTTDQIVKEQSALNRILAYKSSPFERLTYNNNRNFPQPYSAQKGKKPFNKNQNFKPFRGSKGNRSQSYRGRGRGGKSRYSPNNSSSSNEQ